MSAILLGLGFILSFSGCADSCESLQQEFDEITDSFQQNPESVFERGPELEALGNQMEESGCLG
jgi:Tfp pilus assembly protein PilO